MVIVLLSNWNGTELMGSTLTPCIHWEMPSGTQETVIAYLKMAKGKGTCQSREESGFVQRRIFTYTICAVGLPGVGGNLDCLQNYDWLPVLRSQSIYLLISPNFLRFIGELLGRVRGGMEGLRRRSTHCHWVIALMLLELHWLWRAAKGRKRQENKKGARSTIPVSVYALFLLKIKAFG